MKFNRLIKILKLYTMAKLFLLKPDFTNKNRDANTKYFCPENALVNGIINYYPKLKELLDIRYIDFKKPRRDLVKLVGEENQGCPNLVLSKTEINENIDVSYFGSFENNLFVNEPLLIAKYLSEKFNIGIAH